MTEAKIDDLASRLASMTDEDAAQLHRTVAGLQAERARAEEERIAGLRARDDWDLIADICQTAQPDPDQTLALLRDAGFVRGVTLEAAYRAGYSRAVYDCGVRREIPDEDDADYVYCRRHDLTALAKGA